MGRNPGGLLAGARVPGTRGVPARHWVPAILVLAVSWGLAVASVALSWIFGLPAEPLPGVFLSQAPAQVQSRFDDIGVVVALIYAPVAAVLILRRPNPVALILAGHAVGSGLAAFGVQYGLLGRESDGLALWGLLAYTAGWGFVPGTFLTAIVPLLLLRTGPGPVGRVLIPVACTLAALGTFLSITQQTEPSPANPLALPWPAYQSFVTDAYAVSATGTILISVVTAGILILSLVRAPAGARRSVGWLTLGHVFLTASYAVTVLPQSTMIPEAVWQFGMIAPVIGQIFYPAAVLVMGLDQRLWGIDVTVSRVLVTAIVAVLAVLGYHVAMTTLSIAGGGAETGTAFFVAAIVALALHPVRGLVKRRVDLLVYGAAGEPSGLVAALGKSLGAFDSGPDGLRTLADALRASLHLDGFEIDPGTSVVAPQRSGHLRARPAEIPLGNRGAGVLRVSAPDEAGLGREERAALERLAGLIAAVVQLTETGARAKAARADVVAARHEQRRVLRRELHDGMGPALAGAGYSVAAAANLLTGGRTDEATSMLLRVEGQLRERELALLGLAEDDTALELGAPDLAGGLADLLARFESAGPAMAFHADPAMPPVADRTRHALLLIAAEALVNAVRHAHATRIDVRLTASGDTATMEVSDDGVGITGRGLAGVGSASMQEWAGSIQADLSVAATQEGGTRVTVRFAPQGGVNRPA